MGRWKSFDWDFEAVALADFVCGLTCGDFSNDVSVGDPSGGFGDFQSFEPLVGNGLIDFMFAF
jgi:hypothetical protein